MSVSIEPSVFVETKVVGNLVHPGQRGPMSVVYVVKCPVLSVVITKFPVSVSIEPSVLVLTKVVGNFVQPGQRGPISVV